RWDRQLTQQNCLHEWFEIRLRLLAAHRLAGHKDRLMPLARQLHERATQAQDWMTVRRLGRLMAADEKPSPLALLGPLPVGPFAAGATALGAGLQAPPGPPTPTEPTSDLSTDAEQQSAEAAQSTPLEEVFNSLTERMPPPGENDPVPIHNAILNDLLAIDP